MNRDVVRELLQRADREGYGLPAFNYSDIWDLLGIVRAAREERTTVLLASCRGVFKTHGVAITSGLCDGAARSLPGLVIPHIDHALELSEIRDCVGAGFRSVMFDGSIHPLEENIRLTREAARIAHDGGAALEGELGMVGHDGEVLEGEDTLTDPDSVARFVAETDVDSLAVGIGTAHGFYKRPPKLDFDRLARINELVSTPLVLHGGTGIPDADVRKTIALGINKVNVGTVIHATYMRTLRESLAKAGDNPYTINVMAPAVEAVAALVRDKIRMCGASGKMRRD